MSSDSTYSRPGVTRGSETLAQVIRESPRYRRPGVNDADLSERPEVTADSEHKIQTENYPFTSQERDWYDYPKKYQFTFHSPGADKDSDDVEFRIVVQASRFGIAYTRACSIALSRVNGLYDLRSVTSC